MLRCISRSHIELTTLNNLDRLLDRLMNSVNHLSLIARTIYALIAIHTKHTISSRTRFLLLLLRIIYIYFLSETMKGL